MPSSSLASTTTVLQTPPTVRVAVEVDGASSGEVIGDVEASSDPFADFASCSGLHEYFGAYALLVSTVDGPFRAVSVLTNGIVRSGGTHEAVVRLEVDDDPASALTASGTITIDDGYRTGGFLAFTADGVEVSGDFECTGGVDARPLPDPDGADASVTIEAFALVRMSSAERILGLATVADDPSACVGGVSVSGVDGSISSFELTAAPTLRVGIGDVEYVLDDVTVAGDDAAGTFMGSVDDISVDGAYRCT